MKRLAEVIEDISESPPHPYDLYDLAPVYDRFYADHFDYEAQKGTVDKIAPDTTECVAEYACGPGRLLTRIEDEYEIVVGVDASEAMLNRARERTDSANLVNADVTEWQADDSFDLVAMLGNAVTHITTDEEVSALARRARENLRDGGVFVLNLIPYAQSTDGYRSAKTVEDDRYVIDRQVITSMTSPQGDGEMAFSYHLEDKETGA